MTPHEPWIAESNWLGALKWVLAFAAVFVVAAAILDVLPRPTFQRDAKKARSAAEARKILLACKAYASAHQGHGPETLPGLIPGYASKAGLDRVLGDWQSEGGYRYLGYDDSDADDKVVLVVRVKGRPDQRVAGRADGHVEIQKGGGIQQLGEPVQVTIQP